MLSIKCARRLCGSLRNPASLLDYIKQAIKISGPISVAQYMREALTNPKWGYYMRKDVFGKAGDFTTSPEVSQVFGELVGVWFLNQWLLVGKPHVQLVELGPGRGTLIADILRILENFPDTRGKFSVHLVEVSDYMKEMQRNRLGISGEGVTRQGAPVKWYGSVNDVPEGISFYLAHEFFDALPVHLFKRVNGIWRELLVGTSSSGALEFVLAEGPGPLGRLFIPADSKAEECEVCPEAAVTVSRISGNIARHGGCSLVIDYGDEGSERHSIRGFRDHKLIDNIFDDPGSCDITANVDFKLLRKHAHSGVMCHGPITQQAFLFKMGVRERLQALLRTATNEQAKDLASGVKYLVSGNEMGERFKFFALTKVGDPSPAAF